MLSPLSQIGIFLMCPQGLHPKWRSRWARQASSRRRFKPEHLIAKTTEETLPLQHLGDSPRSEGQNPAQMALWLDSITDILQNPCNQQNSTLQKLALTYSIAFLFPSALLIQLCTGHMCLNKHLHCIKRSDSLLFTNQQEHFTLQRMLHRKASNISYPLTNSPAAILLHKYIHSTCCLNETFGAIHQNI